MRTMKTPHPALIPLVLLALLAILPLPHSGRETYEVAPVTLDEVPTPQISYDEAVLSDGPASYFSTVTNGVWRDTVSHLDATFPAGVGWTNFAGEQVPLFNGTSQFAISSDSDAFSVTTTGELTVEAWLSPSELAFPRPQGTGYGHFIGKGDQYGLGGDQEWAGRMYSEGNVEGRANRLAGHIFNPEGGYGAGSFFQQPLEAGQWVHYVFVVNTNDKSPTYPQGYTKLYLNGYLQDIDSIASYGVSPHNGPAPLRIGTRDGESFFPGAVAKVAIYDHELTAEDVSLHHDVARKNQ